MALPRDKEPSWMLENGKWSKHGRWRTPKEDEEEAMEFTAGRSIARNSPLRSILRIFARTRETDRGSRKT